MTTGTSLFHTLSTRGMSQLSVEIADLQGQVTSGKKDPRPSADLLSALRLSAAREQDESLSRYASNVDRALSRLDQSDIVLEEANDIMRRVSELALRAVSDSTAESERVSIAAEVSTLRDSLLAIANARDETGRALFGGFATGADPFVETFEGIDYVGDDGEPELRVSESMTLPSGINGRAIFNPGSQDGAFEAIDGLLSLLRSDVSAGAAATGTDQLDLSFDTGRDPQAWSLTVEGPGGSAEIAFDAAEGALGSVVDAINAQTAATGVTAVQDPATGAIRLTAAGDITVTDVSREDDASGPLVTATDADGNQQPIVAEDATRAAVLDRLRVASDTIIDQRTRAGALAANAERQSDIIAERQTDMTISISKLEDLDLAEALTRLQQLLLSRDASQQTYSRITQQTLFDFLR